MKQEYKCHFEETKFINEKNLEYKNKCDFNNRPDTEPYRKFYDNHLFRYSLKCKIKKKGKSITVILMNPSYADEYGLDSTLCNTRDFLEKNTDFSEFEVLNIFPIRTPNSKHLLSLMTKNSEIQKENDKYIKEVLSKSNDVLIAWGGKYHHKATWIFEFLKGKNVYTYSVNKDYTPRHFAPQAYNRTEKKLQKYRF